MHGKCKLAEQTIDHKDLLTSTSVVGSLCVCVCARTCARAVQQSRLRFAPCDAACPPEPAVGAPPRGAYIRSSTSTGSPSVRVAPVVLASFWRRSP